MDLFEWSQKFSRILKTAKLDYLSGEQIQIEVFSDIIQTLSQLNLSLLDNDQKKKAFWVNIYNGFTNYLIIKLRLKTNMKEYPDFFKSNTLTIHNYKFSLDDIEHGLLRKNVRMHILPNDKRLQFQVKELDYRIHFALNCGAKSCPAIAYYTFNNIEEELDLAESVFIENEFLVNHKEKTIKCSEIFIWYKDDFKKKYLNNPKHLDYTIIKKPYNWQL
ncbi:DUF547 domain-containing protein [Flavobacteriaceae bacterium AU392]|nr:DUF547 domain-containing protein [Flavobacteriaceae bacterium]RKM84620.1 DUF547 domain-containing protein [Flavobacteriaceae bacterium AU392]